jgi:hypothetical protein
MPKGARTCHALSWIVRGRRVKRFTTRERALTAERLELFPLPEHGRPLLTPVADGINVNNAVIILISMRHGHIAQTNNNNTRSRRPTKYSPLASASNITTFHLQQIPRRQQVEASIFTAQHSTAQHGTAQHSTAQHSTAQHTP